MNEETFWKIINASKKKAKDDKYDQVDYLTEQLDALSPEEIIQFQKFFDHFMNKAYSWDNWGAAYIIGKGCSDDSFMDFRSWLISMGKTVYESTLKDVETLASLEIEDPEEECFFEEIQYVASEVYEEKTGEEIPFLEETDEEPKGKEWEEDDEVLRKRFPKLWAKYSE